MLYAFSEPASLRLAEIVKANLRRIGIDVQVKEVGQSIFSRITRRGEPFDLALTAWASDFLDPMDILGQLDGRTIGPEHNANMAYFNDPDFNRRLDAAEQAALPGARSRARAPRHARRSQRGTLGGDRKRGAARLLLGAHRLPGLQPRLRNRPGGAVHPRRTG